VPIGIDRRFNAAPKRRRHEGPTALGIRFASDSLVEGKQDSKPRQVDGALFHSRWFTNGEKHRSHYSDIVGPLPPTAGVLVVIRDGIARSAAAAPRLAPGDYVLALARPKDLALLDRVFLSYFALAAWVASRARPDAPSPQPGDRGFESCSLQRPRGESGAN
jgi:hypothetical protein